MSYYNTIESSNLNFCEKECALFFVKNLNFFDTEYYLKINYNKKINFNISNIKKIVINDVIKLGIKKKTFII